MLVKSTRALIISDMHAPFHHPGAIQFLKSIKKEYKPDLVVNVGDEVDLHALSFHPKDPDNPSAGDEHRQARDVLHELHSVFPKMVLAESNHGSRNYRKALDAGIPRAFLRNYNEVWGIGSGWQWVRDFTFLTPKGPVYVCHGKNASVLQLSKNIGMHAIQGHYHTKFGIQDWGNPLGSCWAMQVGCLIDDEKLAFLYNKQEVERPIIGCGLVLEGAPRLERII